MKKNRNPVYTFKDADPFAGQLPRIAEWTGFSVKPSNPDGKIPPPLYEYPGNDIHLANINYESQFFTNTAAIGAFITIRSLNARGVPTAYTHLLTGEKVPETYLSHHMAFHKLSEIELFPPPARCGRNYVIVARDYEWVRNLSCLTPICFWLIAHDCRCLPKRMLGPASNWVIQKLSEITDQGYGFWSTGAMARRVTYGTRMHENPEFLKEFKRRNSSFYGMQLSSRKCNNSSASGGFVGIPDHVPTLSSLSHKLRMAHEDRLQRGAILSIGTLEIEPRITIYR